MWLKYGVDEDGALVSIEDVRSYKTLLKCPYCNGKLSAKKGKIREHHFAHLGETCRAVGDRLNKNIPTLPLYDKFNLELTSKELVQLKEFRNGGNVTYKVLKRLASLGVVEWNSYKGGTGGYEITKLGKIPFGDLSMMLFNEVQEPMLGSKLINLQRAVLSARNANSPLLQEKLTDLRLYRIQLKRILTNTLYFLEVQADGQIFHKIGVTRRPIEERVAEILGELQSHFSSLTIKVMGTWEHRGNVELYFKHRYKEFNHPIVRLTEYYKFDEKDAKVVLLGLRRMKPKVLTQAEIDIFSDKPNPVEIF